MSAQSCVRASRSLFLLFYCESGAKVISGVKSALIPYRNFVAIHVIILSFLHLSYFYSKYISCVASRNMYFYCRFGAWVTVVNYFKTFFQIWTWTVMVCFDWEYVLFLLIFMCFVTGKFKPSMCLRLINNSKLYWLILSSFAGGVCKSKRFHHFAIECLE